MPIDLEVQYALDTGPDLPSAAQVRYWVEAALDGRRTDAELTVRIVDRAESSQLNMAYRQRPGPTNVLSFPMESPPGVPVSMLGDIVICAPVVLDEAREQGKPAEAHWAHLVVHGMLHLLGYDHQEPTEAHRMESLEARILQRLGYSDPYVLNEDYV
jgi:probable rRNA maturation factor